MTSPSPMARAENASSRSAFSEPLLTRGGLPLEESSCGGMEGMEVREGVERTESPRDGLPGPEEEDAEDWVLPALPMLPEEEGGG